MSEQSVPAVTISLVTWNGLRWLPGCLDSVAAQTLDDYELLILDNGSTDGSVEWLRERAAGEPRITLVDSDVNLGYARAHNRNIDLARGDVVLLLNQDVELDPGFMAAAVKVLSKRSDVGSVQGRLLRLSPAGVRTDAFDTTGLVMYRDRRVVSRDQLSKAGDSRASTAGPVWGVDGAAPVYRRSAIETARLPRTGGGREVLDEDFFSYKEDVDLAWRLRRLGWSAWYEPDALAWHARGGGDTGATGWRDVIRANMSNPPMVRALSWRNHRLMQFKNEEPGAFFRDFPWIARRESQAWLFMLLADPRRLRAMPELLRRLPQAMRKRRALMHRISLGTAPSRAVGSPSWPTRMLSRLRVSNVGRTATYFRRQGLGPTARRVSDGLREQLWAATSGSSNLTGVRQVRPRRISAKLDRPRHDGLEGSARLGLLGWAHSKDGIESVGVYLDGEMVGPAVTGRARPDVASAWRHLDQAGIEGFNTVISLEALPPGQRTVSAVVRDRAGNVRILTRRFRRLNSVIAYQRFLDRSTGPETAHPSVNHLGVRRRGETALLVVVALTDGDLTATLRSIAAQSAGQWQCVVLTRGSAVQAVGILRWRSLAQTSHDDFP